MGATLWWLRQDLRLRDNEALLAACARGQPVIPVYIWSPEEEGRWPPGAASRWWLHQSLLALAESLRALGARLILRRGPAPETLRALAGETGATAVFWSRRYEPAAEQCSRAVERSLRRAGVDTHEFSGSLLAEPTELRNRSDRPYQVYTPFQRRLLAELDPPRVRAAPRSLPVPRQWPGSLELDALQLMPRRPWYLTLAAHWRPGERGARARLAQFVATRLRDYERQRDRPAAQGTSGLSPHLHFGELGPREIWHALGPRARGSVFVRELIWREFAYYLLHHFPHTTDQPLREEFAHFPWRQQLQGLAEWQHGRTGVPMVDAGMRELWTTGVMHNRARMIAASFLVKNLLLPWQEGARWFWDTLVDADLANNTLNWQWVAGSGADAAPYFRVFNPVAQGQRFDARGEYVRRWIEPLRSLPVRCVHEPWRCSEPPRDYPPPIVDLAESRQAALAAWRDLRATVSG